MFKLKYVVCKILLDFILHFSNHLKPDWNSNVQSSERKKLLITKFFDYKFPELL